MAALQSYFDESHQMVRDSVRRFVEREILPFIDEWEEAEEFPRELYKKAGDAGILGIGFPEHLGGSHEGDLFAKIAASEELIRSSSTGLVSSLCSLDIGLPPVLKWAKPHIRDRVVPEVLAGDKIIALAITEPGGGSDVANLKTRAVRDGTTTASPAARPSSPAVPAPTITPWRCAPVVKASAASAYCWWRRTPPVSVSAAS